MMKKKVTHIKKIEYTPSDGFHFIKRSTHEFLKTRNELSLADISANSIADIDFVDDKFICADDEEVRTFLEFYEQHKQGVQVHVFLKRDFKDYIEIPTDEYAHDLNLYLKVVMRYFTSNIEQKEIGDKSSGMYDSNYRYYNSGFDWPLIS